MAILQGDIKLVKSQVMDDVPEGGGAPTGQVIASGVSNAIFKDISEVDRAGGAVSLRKVFATVHTPDQDTYLDAHVIVAKPPLDPNVSISLFMGTTFDTRAESQQRVEAYLNPGPEISGFLLENHVIGQRSIQIFQRPGVDVPNIGRTLVLIYLENQVGERRQYVRITRTTVTIQTFTIATSSGFIEYTAQVVLADISDALRFDFPGSPPSRLFALEPSKTHIRDTSVADAGSYFGTSPLAEPLTIGDVVGDVESVYTQLVPSSRSETTALDQKPAAQRTLTLSTAPRLVEVPNTPHTLRIRISQENRGFSFVQLLRPFPEPNTIVVSYLALGQWYTIQDNGSGQLTGSGVGTVNYATGSISITLPSLPDDGSSIIFSWGEKTAFNDRSGLTSFRAPEYAIKLEKDGLKPGTVVITWQSAGVTKTALDNGAGVLTGHATGEVNYAAGMVFIRPSAMIDPGGQFHIDFQWTTMTTKSVDAVPDAGGYILITLDDVPVAGSVSVAWRTVRTISNSSGATSGGNSTKTNTSKTTNISYPANPTPPAPAPGQPPPPPPPKPAVVMSRIATDKLGAYNQYMAPAGTRIATGEAVFIEITAQFDAQGFYYSVPDTTGLTWNESEFQGVYGKTIGGVFYERWAAADHNGVGPA
ncbi:MAG: hypothetical protein EOO27_13175 [Comamonadaceae bacterium]|nr:MAG: hypothetical protein EOO27_13175 [Comamonadaceae bacterium]